MPYFCITVLYDCWFLILNFWLVKKCTIEPIETRRVLRSYSRRIYYCYHQNTKWLLCHPIIHFWTITILDFSLLLLVKISLFALYKDFVIYIYKRYFIIHQQIVWHFEHYSECLSNPLPFYATQLINHFLNSRVSANKGWDF